MAQMRFSLQQGAIPHGRGYSIGRYHFTNSCEYNTGRTAHYACIEVSKEICKQENDLLSQSTHLVRYADDFIITGISKEALEEIKPLVVDFLKERGLTLSEEKTKIT